MGFEYDKEGNLKYKVDYSKKTEIYWDDYGVVRREYVYNKNGDLIEGNYIDFDGNLWTEYYDENEYLYKKIKKDKHGEIIEEVDYDNHDEYDSDDYDEYDSDDYDEYDSDEYDEYDSDEYDSDEYDEYDSDDHDEYLYHTDEEIADGICPNYLEIIEIEEETIRENPLKKDEKNIDFE